MKIEKGYTLSQFVDFDTANGMLIGPATQIVAYNNRLREKLTKDMFVNPYEKPCVPVHDDSLGVCSAIYDQELGRYMEAESKVIFKGWKYNQPDASRRCMPIFISCGDFQLGFFNVAVFFDNIKTGETKRINTLGDLFQATNGELETKNFEI